MADYPGNRAPARFPVCGNREANSPVATAFGFVGLFMMGALIKLPG